MVEIPCDESIEKKVKASLQGGMWYTREISNDDKACSVGRTGTEGYDGIPGIA
jgi:hypothetical protein